MSMASLYAEPEFVNLLRTPGIDSQPGGLQAPYTFTNMGSV
jgi:hypothetical protein